MPDGCQHKNFDSFAVVNRLEDTWQFSVDLRIECSDCKLPFRFLGLPVGLNLRGAAVSVDGLEARLAICPKNESGLPLGDPGTVQGFSVRPIK